MGRVKNARRRWPTIAVVMIALALAAYWFLRPAPPEPAAPAPVQAAPAAAPAPDARPPERLKVKVLSVRPHDPQSFTQGLVLDHGTIYESAGEYGSSSLREADPRTGTVKR